MTRHEKEKQLAKDAVRRAVKYLRACKIKVPRFALTTNWNTPIGGSMVIFDGTRSHLNMGRYPTAFLRDWLAMHELGHVLWNHHQPLRRKKFRVAFGAPAPANYHQLHLRHSWKTAATHRLSWLPGIHRPAGEPSWYGAKAGGQERFCEVLGLLWAQSNFAADPPPDLAELWDTCWHQGLAHMV